MHQDPKSPWWAEFYDDLLAEIHLVREDEVEREATVRFLTETLRLSPGARVFDQCCGIGSLSLPLAARGVEVIGVDYAEGYVRRAQQDASAKGLRCRYVHGDAFEFVACPPCDAAFNWGSSFGYTQNDEKNRQMLARVFESLVPGGRFALDVPNMPGVIRGFQPVMLRRKSLARGEVLLLRESQIDLEAGALRQTWTYLLPDGTRRTHQSELRLYFPHQIGEMLTACGFADISFYGGVEGAPLTPSSLRCILVARRPTR